MSILPNTTFLMNFEIEYPRHPERIGKYAHRCGPPWSEEASQVRGRSAAVVLCPGEVRALPVGRVGYSNSLHFSTEPWLEVAPGAKFQDRWAVGTDETGTHAKARIDQGIGGLSASDRLTRTHPITACEHLLLTVNAKWKCPASHCPASHPNRAKDCDIIGSTILYH
jgi:hypothetical protein